jgi:predicted SprT family Zn-dependent metalloprotease
MKQAITNLLAAITERVKPHGHEWKAYHSTKIEKVYFNGSTKEFAKYYFQCIKCQKERVIKS